MDSRIIFDFMILPIMILPDLYPLRLGVFAREKQSSFLKNDSVKNDSVKILPRQRNESFANEALENPSN